MEINFHFFFMKKDRLNIKTDKNLLIRQTNEILILNTKLRNNKKRGDVYASVVLPLVVSSSSSGIGSS